MAKMCVGFVSVMVVLIAYLLSLVDIDPADTVFPPLRPLPDDIQPIENVETFFSDDESFKGPESFVMNEDQTFYTGLADGRIVKVNLNLPSKSYVEIARTGQSLVGCGQLSMESQCGRPLGMRRDPNNSDHLIVTDAYMGLLSVNTITGDVKVLVDSKEYHLTLLNDLDIHENIVYFTNTGHFPRNQIHKMLIEARPTGSVYAYDLKTGHIRKIVSNLIMPNGICVSHDGKSLFVIIMNGVINVPLPNKSLNDHNDDNKNQVLNFNLSQWDLPLKYSHIQDDVQGSPDNIRRNDHKTYYIALGSKRSSPFSLPQFLAPYKILRKLSSLIGLELITNLIPKTCLMIEMNEQGKILNTFQDQTISCYWLSEVEDIGDGNVLLGSWRTPFIARGKIHVTETRMK